MKNIKLLFLSILSFLLCIDCVYAAYGHYMGIGEINITNDKTQYIIRGSHVKRPSLLEKQNFVFDQQNAAHYNYKIEEWLKNYVNSNSNVGFTNSLIDDAGNQPYKSLLIPAELVTNRVFWLGGSSGSCMLVNDAINCNYRDIPSEWHEAQQIQESYLKSAYPYTIGSLISISRADEDNPVPFQTDTNLPNNILSNGKVDSEGRYVSLKPLKVYQSEYNSGFVKLSVLSGNPFGSANLLFSRDGYTYLEKYGAEAIYDNIIDKNGMTLKKWTGKYVYPVSIDRENNIIHGMWYSEFGTWSPYTQNKVIENIFSSTGMHGFGVIYEFEIPIQVVPDENKEENIEENKVLTGMQENNAKIFINDEETSILNKKDYDLGRIYVSLDDICKNIDSCKIEQDRDNDNKLYYRITRKILNTDIEFSLIHYPETKIFETSVYRNNNKVGYDIISPAKGSIDADSRVIDNILYVPIRFLLQGLGANITYIGSKSNDAPEEVHIAFDDTANITIESETLKSSSQNNDKYKTSNSENNLRFILDLEGIKNFYVFQINDNNAPLEKISETDDYKVVFPSTNIYNYLIIGKIKHNDSELLIYKTYNFEYIE